ncbi:MAG: hypothetical protein ISP39_04380 [Alphaproteobacteria bacterium]|jgi:hypothetical protein|nr:hypothetical protein [Alphaproteobacteria bacterium]HCA15076.1 hypothetical protein [Alphaproteobacteria bacterium]
MTPNIARIYKRTFKAATDVAAFMDAVSLIKPRLTAVDVKYRLYHCEENPLVLFEIWEYPDEDAMEWVKASMEGATAVPRRFSVETEAFTAQVKAAIDIEE